MTRRFCACGVTRWTRLAFELHLDPARPGCREVTHAEYAELHGQHEVDQDRQAS